MDFRKRAGLAYNWLLDRYFFVLGVCLMALLLAGWVGVAHWYGDREPPASCPPGELLVQLYEGGLGCVPGRALP